MTIPIPADGDIALLRAMAWGRGRNAPMAFLCAGGMLRVRASGRTRHVAPGDVWYRCETEGWIGPLFSGRYRITPAGREVLAAAKKEEP